MLNFIRNIWALNTHKYSFDGSILDLSYITDRIIAMSYPGAGMELMYCHPRDKVEKFLTTQHPGHLLVINASDRLYSFNSINNVINVPWEDHRPCPLSLLLRVVLTAAHFLKQDSKNTVVVHCWGGKGRTGVIVAALLLFMRETESMSDAKQLFRERRGVGVTRKGQLRYLDYAEKFYWNKTAEMQLQPRRIKGIRITGPPKHFGKKQFFLTGSDLSNANIYFELEFSGNEFEGGENSGNGEAFLNLNTQGPVPMDLTIKLFQHQFWKTALLFNLNFSHLFVLDEITFTAADFDNCSAFAKSITIKFEFENRHTEENERVAQEFTDLEARLRKLKEETVE